MRVENCKDVEDAGKNPYTEAQLIHILFNIFYETGNYNQACKKWTNLLASEKTYENTKHHFRKAYNELSTTASAQDLGFGTANAASLLNELAENTQATLKSVTSATVANKNTIKNLQQKIMALQLQMQSMTSTVPSVIGSSVSNSTGTPQQ